MQRVKVEVEPTRSALATAMLSSKQHLRPRAVVGYGINIFVPRPLHYVTRSPGKFGLYNLYQSLLVVTIESSVSK